MLVDHFDAPNTFIGIMAAVQSATMVGAYVVVGRLIDRGSSLRQTLTATVLTLLVPMGYLVAPTYWAILPFAVIAGVCAASGELTYHTNLVQLAPPGRLADYAAVQSLLLGVRGSLAPFAASALLGTFSAHGALLVGLAFMVGGTIAMVGAVRDAQPVTAPAVAPAS
jgi:hypothetical protein